MDRALTELIVAESAKRGGVRTPDPSACSRQRMYGPLWRLAFLSAEVTESEDLIHYCCRLSEYPPETAALEKRGVIREAAEQIRKMHDLGIHHADLHLKNLLLRRRADGHAGGVPARFRPRDVRAAAQRGTAAEEPQAAGPVGPQGPHRRHGSDGVGPASVPARLRARPRGRARADAPVGPAPGLQRPRARGVVDGHGRERNLRGDGLGTLAGPRSTGARR